LACALPPAKGVFASRCRFYPRGGSKEAAGAAGARVIDLTGMTGGGMAQESIRGGGGPSCWWCALRGGASARATESA